MSGFIFVLTILLCITYPAGLIFTVIFQFIDQEEHILVALALGIIWPILAIIKMVAGVKDLPDLWKDFCRAVKRYDR